MVAVSHAVALLTVKISVGVLFTSVLGLIFHVEK